MITFEELQRITIIDTHVHRIHPERAPEWGNLGGGYIPGPGQNIHARQTILYGMIIEALRNYYVMSEEASWDDIESERYRRYSIDPIGYYSKLIEECNVAMHCLEIGSPIGAPAYSPEEIAYFNATIKPEKSASIVRFDRIIDELLCRKLTFQEFEDAYHYELLASIERENAVGLKSCIAYNGGLSVSISTRDATLNAYERILNEKARPDDKHIFYCHMLLESMDIAANRDLPVQLHTGFGSGKYIDFQSMNPIHLIDFLQDSRVKNRVKIVLLHGGHPHEEYASYLAAQFANVYTDFSGAFYLNSIKGMERMAALMERAPLDKVMYGSDGVMFPEVSWFAHMQFRRLLSKLLNVMINDGYFTQGRARDVAKMFMYDNALLCYSKLQRRLSS